MRGGATPGRFSIGSQTELYLGFGFHTTSTGAADILVFQSSGGEQAFLHITSMTLTARRGATVLATAGTALSINTWYWIEIHYKLADSGGIFDVKVNGSDTGMGFTFTGDTKNTATADFNQLNFLASTNFYGDDLIVNTTAGSDNNTWPGEIRVAGLVVTGAGDNTGLPSTAGSATHWQNVDEVPPSDADYNYDGGSVGGNLYDLYNLAATSGSIGDISAVVLWTRASKSDAGTGNFRHVWKTGGTEYRSAADIALSTSITAYPEIRENNPNTTNAWTASELDALQVGFDAR